MSRIIASLVAIATPMPRTTPDDWGARNRVYPPSSGKPGPRDPHYTPYMIAFGRAVAGHQYKRVVGIVGSQMGKTDTFLDVIGQRLDQRPVPILYVGPTQAFVTDQFEPRVMALLDEAPTLARKVARGGEAGRPSNAFCNSWNAKYSPR